MCVCVYIYIYIYIHTHTYTHTRARVFSCRRHADQILPTLPAPNVEQNWVVLQLDRSVLTVTLVGQVFLRKCCQALFRVIRHVYVYQGM